MINIKRIARLIVALIMVFGAFSSFAPMPLAAFGVSVGSQEIHASGGPAEVVFNVSVQAGTMVHNAWVSLDGATASISNEGSLAGRMFYESETVPLTVLIDIPHDHRGGTILGSVNVNFDGGTASGMLTVHLGDPAPTPGPTPAPITPQSPVILMSAPTSHVEMAPGVATIVNVTLQNTSRFHARNFNVIPRADGDFSVAVVGQLHNFNVMAGASRTFSLQITPHARMESGTHTISFDYTFENNVREVTTQQGSIIARIYRPVPGEPRVVISDFILEPMQVFAGDDFVVRAGLRNTATSVANNVQLSVGGFAESGLISRGSTTNFVGSVPANTRRDVDFVFGAGTRMSTGSYPITFTLRHDNAAGETVTENFTFYVTIMGDGAANETDRARLAITGISQPSGTFTPGQQAQFNVTVQNNGERDAANIRISAVPEDGVVPRLASIQTLPTLAVGQSHTFTFAFAPTASAQSQFHNIGFAVAFDTGQTEDGAPARDSFEQFSGMNVYNPDADDRDDEPNRSVPRIIISDYTVEPLIVMANTEFDLSLTMLNTHSERTIGNIRVTWEVAAITVGNEITGGNVFTPVDSSNTFFIDAIPPRGVYEHHLRLFAIPDAAPRNHVITINFECEDEDANPFEATESIGVNVRQESRLEMSVPHLPSVVSQGDRVGAEIILLNAGRSTLFNLRVRVEGEGITPAEEVFGNVQSGHFNNFWANFFAEMPGPTVVNIIATFDNEMGEQQIETLSFDLDIMAVGGFDDWDDGDFIIDWDGGGGDFPGRFPDDGRMPGDDGIWTNIWFWAAIAGGVIVVVGAVVLVVKLKAKRNNSFDFGGDDELL